jgi:translation elongation factor P/translation initiation factor 5A
MTVRATELRKGTVIVGERGELLLITEYHHHTPGNLRAVIHAKVKNLATGNVTPLRWGSSDAFEVAYLDKKKCEYLYKDSTGYHFMDQETFEQFPISEELVGEMMGYVRENTPVVVTFHGDRRDRRRAPGERHAQGHRGRDRRRAATRRRTSRRTRSSRPASRSRSRRTSPSATRSRSARSTASSSAARTSRLAGTGSLVRARAQLFAGTAVERPDSYLESTFSRSSHDTGFGM